MADKMSAILRQVMIEEGASSVEFSVSRYANIQTGEAEAYECAIDHYSYGIPPGKGRDPDPVKAFALALKEYRSLVSDHEDMRARLARQPAAEGAQGKRVR